MKGIFSCWGSFNTYLYLNLCIKFIFKWWIMSVLWTKVHFFKYIKVKVDKWIKHTFWQPIPVWGLGWHWLMLLLEEKKIDMFIINGLCICYCQWALKTGAKVANPIWPLQTSEHASNYPGPWIMAAKTTAGDFILVLHSASQWQNISNLNLNFQTDS